MKKKQNEIRKVIHKGFSLIELLVVVAILSVLAVLGFIGYNKYIQNARKSVNEANAKSLADALTAEAVSPVICTDSSSLISDPNNFKGANLVDPSATGMAIVICANKILSQNNIINPFGNKPYSPLNNTCGYPMVGNTQTSDGYNPITQNPDGTPYSGGLFVGVDASQVLTSGWGAQPCTPSGNIYCSDQLNGNNVIDPGTGLALDSNTYLPTLTSPGTGLMVVVDGITKKFGVAACNPYTSNPNGVIGAIFTVKSDMAIQ